MIAHDRVLDDEQRSALEAPLERSLAIVGGAGSGKSTVLAARVERALQRGGEVVVLAGSERFGALAFRLLAALGPPVRELGEYEAFARFERAVARLCARDVPELAHLEDLEVAGLGRAERFARAAFRLIGKLRAALVSPEEFRGAGLRGATRFAGAPPNLADVVLLDRLDRKEHAALRVDSSELARQHEREATLVELLAHLYRELLAATVEVGALTPADAVCEAGRCLAQAAPEQRASLAPRALFVDDAQDCTPAQARLLAALLGPDLGGLTVAGDPQQATLGFSHGARAHELLGRAALTVELQGRYRGDATLVRAAQIALGAPVPNVRSAGPRSVEFVRGEDVAGEARELAARFAERIRAGTPPRELALVLRSLRSAEPYIAALLARRVPVDCAGAGDPLAFAST
ncbi:MAG: UvrD-helicase domain-containing protein, partial [Vulcanimicrobiaceae bacterium]